MKYALLVLMGLSAVACTETRFTPAAPPPAGSAPRTTVTNGLPTASAPADSPAGGAQALRVNGQPIYMDDLVRPLIEAHGLSLSELLIADVLVAQEAQRLALSVTDADVSAESDRSLRGLISDDLTPDQRQQVLKELLSRQGLTRQVWDNTMRRNALLRRMAMPKVAVTEAAIKTAYSRQYGEMALVSHIQLPSASEADKIIVMLKDGEDFGRLAKRFSTNSATARSNGQLPPFGREDASVPKAIRDAAFSLQPGQVSGIVQVSNDFHVLRVEKRYVPAHAEYEQVKDKLRQQLEDEAVQRLQGEILMELRRKANIEYVDPTLRRAATPPAG